MNQLLKQIQDRIKELRAWQRDNPRPKPLGRDQVYIGQTVWYRNCYQATVVKVNLATIRPSITLEEDGVMYALAWSKSARCWMSYDDGSIYLHPTIEACALAKKYNEYQYNLEDTLDYLPKLP